MHVSQQQGNRGESLQKSLPTLSVQPGASSHERDSYKWLEIAGNDGTGFP